MFRKVLTLIESFSVLCLRGWAPMCWRNFGKKILISEIPVKTFRGHIIEVFLHGGLCPNGLKAFRAKTPKSNDALRKPRHFCPWPQKFQLRPLEVKSSRFLFMRGCAPMGWRHFGQKIQNQMMRCENRATFVPDLRNSS